MINKLNKLYRLITQYSLKQSDSLYTLSDQSIVSLCNFFVTVIIIKFLGLEIFGKYSFLWMIALYMNSVQQSFIISPMYSIAPQKNKQSLVYYYAGVFFQQIIFSVISFLIIYLGLKFLSNLSWFHETEKYSVSFAFAIFAFQIQNFVRRLFFSQKKIISATLCDLIAYTSLIVSLIYLNHINELNLVNIFWSYTITFSIGILIGIPNLLLLKFNYDEILNSFQTNWPTSKWLTLSTTLHWFSGNLWFINAGIILGPFMFGIIRACVALGQIFNIFFQAIENIIPGKMSKTFAEKGLLEMHNYVKKITLQGWLFTLAIFAFIFIFSKLLLGFFYGETTSEYYYILILIGLLQLINYFQFPLSYALRTLGKAKVILIAYAISSSVALTTSKVIITKFNLVGFFFGLYATQIILVVALLLGYLYLFKKEKFI